MAAVPGEVDLVDWEFPGASAQGGAERVLVLIPKRRSASTKLPVLITHHGRGESRRGAEAGAYGWVRDYKLLDVLKALGRGALTRDDFLGFVETSRLNRHNESLAARPYGEMIIVCPHTPDILDAPRTLERAEPYTDWLASELVPRIKEECPLEPGALGIDGVSLGGRMSMLAGLAHPELFRAVGTLQPAFQVTEAKAVTARAKVFHSSNTNAKIRLLSSTKDYFLDAVAALHEQFNAAQIPHEHLVVPGPHDYEFNRGPGAIEMLMWHDRVLRSIT
ncbi:MAG: alpha/beta hydrolase-fold protein [Polyangiaceae bacterium]